MAYTITFAPKEEAFDSEKVQKFVDKILSKLQTELNIELRA
jgi:phenylalanyl-tRNA synthetase beta chain